MIEQRLRDLQGARKQEEMATAACISQSSWSSWLANAPQQLRALARLAAHFGVSADYLLGLTDDPTPHNTEWTEAQRMAAQSIGDMTPHMAQLALDILARIAETDYQFLVERERVLTALSVAETVEEDKQRNGA